MKVKTVVLLLFVLYAAVTAFSNDAEIMEAYKNPKTWKALVSSITSETSDDIPSENVKSAGFQSREAVNRYIKIL